MRYFNIGNGSVAAYDDPADAPNGAVEITEVEYVTASIGSASPIVPASVTRRQGRLALLAAGKLAAVESNIAAITDATQKMQAQIEYEADTWERGNPFLQSMWASLGGTEADLDTLFIEAATL